MCPNRFAGKAVELHFKSAPSLLKALIFFFVPSLYPPIAPFERITRWHGIITGKGFLLRALPTALHAFGLPDSFATHLYVRVSPFGIAAAMVSTLI